MLMRTDPFRELDRFTQQVFGTPSRPAAIPVDAYSTDSTFVVEFDLPGVSPDSIDLTVERNVLTVRAARQRTVSEGTEMVIGERPMGTFSRQLFLGETLDAERISAGCRDGVLRLEIPVAERAKPRKVPVEADSRDPAALTV